MVVGLLMLVCETLTPFYRCQFGEMMLNKDQCEEVLESAEQLLMTEH